jgi:hypothetical protein
MAEALVTSSPNILKDADNLTQQHMHLTLCTPANEVESKWIFPLST